MNVDPEKMPDLLTKSEQEIRTTKAEYERIGSRVGWLADRITPVDDHSEGLAAFTTANRRYRVSEMGLSSIVYRWVDEQVYTTEDIDEARGKERAAVHQVVASVKALLGHPPPAPKLRTRLRRRCGQVTAPVTRWRARRQVERDARKPSSQS
jgi:hypothetical protein